MDYQIFPGGRRKAVTFGFDDGEIHDRRLAEMLRQYGLKATFFLVSGQMGLTVDPFFLSLIHIYKSGIREKK